VKIAIIALTCLLAGCATTLNGSSRYDVTDKDVYECQRDALNAGQAPNMFSHFYENCIRVHSEERGATKPVASGAVGPAASTAAATSPTPVTPVPGVDQLSMALPPGFVLRPVPEKLKSVGAVFYAANEMLNIAVTVIPFRHEGVTDLTAAFALAKRAIQADWLKDATFSEVTGLEIGGRKAARFRATGTYNNLKLTYVSTLIEGHDQIVFITAWTGATNAQQQMTMLESLAGTVSGIS
jgi:hypothetical protein